MVNMADSQQAHPVMPPHAWADIDLKAVQHNFLLAKSHLSSPLCRACAVVKSNAYGHGVRPIVAALNQVMSTNDQFAVVSWQEASIVKEVVPDRRVLVMRGPVSAAEMSAILRDGMDWVIHSPYQWDLLLAAIEQDEPGVIELLARSQARVWVKINTGMNRLGMPLTQAEQVLTALQELPFKIPVGLMSHLATADDLNDALTGTQAEAFQHAETVLALPEHSLKSFAASAGILSWPQLHKDMVRPGIMLYGATPMMGRVGPDDGLRPVMNLKSRLIAVNQVKAGDSIGYGATFMAERDMRVGVIGLGYGDGYPRHAPSGTRTLVNTEQGVVTARLAGRVSMDMLTVDLSHDLSAKPGDEVLLWGQAWGHDLSANEIADAAGTIPYELFCRLTQRVPRFYIQS
jgi:alanine racemase